MGGRIENIENYVIIIHRGNLCTASDNAPLTFASSIIFQGPGKQLLAFDYQIPFMIITILKSEALCFKGLIWELQKVRAYSLMQCKFSHIGTAQLCRFGSPFLLPEIIISRPLLRGRRFFVCCSFHCAQAQEPYLHTPASFHISKFSTIQSHHYVEGQIASCYQYIAR